MADCGAFEAEDIVKYGDMMIKRPPTSAKVRFKAWQSKFFVLRDKIHNVPQRLDYYKDESAFEFQKPAEHCFYLDNVVYMGETHSSKSHCYPIMVVCGKQGPFTLACDTEEARKDWIQTLNRVAVKINGNGSPDLWMQSSVDDSPAATPELTRRADSEISTKPTGSSQNSEEDVPHGKLTRTRTVTSAVTTPPGYFVTTRLTPPSERNNIRGDYILCVTEGEIVLKSVDRYLTVVMWPVSHLRSFLSESAASAGVKDMQLLTLHAGSRSATGEGIFQFFTKHGDTIADEIRLRSQHAFKTVAQKREAFRTRSSTGSDASSPPTAQPAKKLQRGMTAPPKKLSNTWTTKDRGALMESLKRSRADTAPSSQQKVEANSSPAPANVAGNEASPTNHIRPRSATDSAVEKTGDDDVFVTQSAYCEIDNDDSSVTEESDVNAYIDLVSDDTVEPIHISDPVPPRKISNESLTSTCSLTSDDGSLRSSCSLTKNFSGAQLIPEENEMDAEGYIKCEALQTGPEENILDRNGNNIDFFMSENLAEVCEMPGTHSRGLPSCPDEENKSKSGSLQLASNNARLSRKMRDNLLAQITAPSVGTFSPKPKLERENPLTAENVYEDEPRSPDDPVDSLLEKARDPEGSKKLLDQILAQMEKPQQHDVSELFPASTRKRNSTGAVTFEAARDIQLKLSGKRGHSQSFSVKKHAVIEKSQSTCDVFSHRALSPGPPPLPNRPDSVETPRRRVCSSVGDISEDLPRRPEHRSTFFAKGMGSVNPQTLMTPLRTSISAHLGGEAAIHARLIEKTEIRDELAQSSAARNKTAAVEDSSSCVIANGAATCSIADEPIVNNTESLESPENIDEDGQGEVSKRKDSKATKFVKKVWKLAPKPKRGSNEVRETYDEYSVPSDRPRRESLSPGDAMELQGRFSGSEPSTPESSPKLGRKNSKTSPKASRKISSEEKVKKDKESSASKILGKMNRGDVKKNESGQILPGRKISREESPKKDISTADTTARAVSSKSHHKTAWPEKSTKESKESNEIEKMMDRAHEGDKQLAHAEDIEWQSTPTKSGIRDPAPALPPRKKFEPPPLPPRLPKSSPSVRPVSPPAHSSSSNHGTRVPQPAASTSREGRRHTSSSRHPSGSGPKEEFLPPPPVPPRNSQSPEPKNVPASGRSSARAPVIQLTCSSPENPDDTAEKPNSDSDGDATNVTTGVAPKRNPPTMSAAPRSPESLSHPVPRRPPKGERKNQAKDFFRSHANQRVYVQSSDSEMEDSDFPPHSPKYGNIDEIRMAAARACEEQEALAKEREPVGKSGPQAPDSTDSNYVQSPVNSSEDKMGVIKSQKEALRLKINMMKEPSVDDDDGDDLPFERDNAEDLPEKSKPKRPSTPLSIRRNVWTLSSVSIN